MLDSKELDYTSTSFLTKLKWAVYDLPILSSILFHLSKTISFCKKLFSYSRILWKDEDWDYSFILTLLVFKLERVNAGINSSHLAHEEKVKTKRQIGLVIKLFNRHLNDKYFDWLERPIKKQYGEDYDKYLSRSDDFLYKIMYGQRPTDYLTRFSDIEKKHIGQKRLRAINTSDKMKTRDLSRAFKIMTKYVESWWT